jgi:hypothetical protein
MGLRSLRRFSTWLALAAMLASIAAPAHAAPSRDVRTDDLCVGGKLVPGTPATPGATHGCDACCASTPSAPPPAQAAPAVVPPAMPRAAAIDFLPLPLGGLRAALARAPPILL